MDTYRGLVGNNVLSEHAGHSLVAAVAPVGAGPHDSSGLTAVFLKGDQTSWHVELKGAAAASRARLHHNDDRLVL
jgi:hypothetical protein